MQSIANSLSHGIKLNPSLAESCPGQVEPIGQIVTKTQERRQIVPKQHFTCCIFFHNAVSVIIFF